MLTTGIEPAALRLLTRGSNQLSYAAAQNHHLMQHKQIFSDWSITIKTNFLLRT